MKSTFRVNIGSSSRTHLGVTRQDIIRAGEGAAGRAVQIAIQQAGGVGMPHYLMSLVLVVKRNGFAFLRTSDVDRIAP